MWNGSYASRSGAKFVTTGLFFCLFLVASAQAQTGFDVGICVHLADNPDMLPRQLSLIGEAGANSVRDDVHWSHVEPQKGHLIIPPGVDDLVNQALKANVQPLLILDYGNSFYDSGNKPVTPEALSAFARFAAFVVQHFKGRVHMYEMWNEWDDTTGGTRRGTPQEYARFLRVVYPAVKANDRSAVFLAGAISVGGLDFLSAMLSAGALGSFDALSIHSYNFSKHTRTADGWAQDMLATEAVIHRYTGGRDIPLYVSEMGWPTYSGPGGSSPKEAATLLAQMFLLARTMNFLKGIWWYNFRDDGFDESKVGDTFGLVDPNLKPKPAFVALKEVASIVREAWAVEALPTDSQSLHAVIFRLQGDKQVLALWNTSQAGVIQVRVIGSTPLQIQSVLSDNSDVHPIRASTTEQTLGVSDIPMLITGSKLSLKKSN
jgi:hypothetical protein